LTERPLPEIPSNGRGPQTKTRRGKSARAADEVSEPSAKRRVRAEVPVAAALSNGSPREEPARRAVSRIGGAVLLGAAGAVAIALVLVFVVFAGGSAHKSPAAAAHSSTTANTTPKPKVISQIYLTHPGGGNSPVGVAEVISSQGKTGVAIAAQGLAPNRKRPPNYYAVWLYNGPGSEHLLGFAAAVTSSGVLRTLGALPNNASDYQKLLLTLETSPDPKAPGKIVLEGSGKF
jgi:hypothetical protein